MRLWHVGFFKVILVIGIAYCHLHTIGNQCAKYEHFMSKHEGGVCVTVGRQAAQCVCVPACPLVGSYAFVMHSSTCTGMYVRASVCLLLQEATSTSAESHTAGPIHTKIPHPGKPHV